MTAVPLEHTGRYGCPVCPRRFTDLAEKKKHVRKHGPKPAKAER